MSTATDIEVFCLVAKDGDIVAIRAFLDKNSDAVDVPNKYGWTALMYAACHGCTDAVELLLENGADIHKADTRGRTALHQAAAEGRVETIALLLEKGAEINRQDADGWSPLMYAAWHVNGSSAVPFLLENGADAGLKSIHGTTALMLAQQDDNTKIIALLESWDEIRQQRQAAEKAQQEREEAIRAGQALTKTRLESLKIQRPAKPVLKGMQP